MTGNDAVSNAGYSYSGSISLRRAVEKTSNVATYRLYEELGTRTCMKYLEALNFKGLDKKDYKYNTTCLGGFTNGTTVVEGSRLLLQLRMMESTVHQTVS